MGTSIMWNYYIFLYQYSFRITLIGYRMLITTLLLDFCIINFIKISRRVIQKDPRAICNMQTTCCQSLVYLTRSADNSSHLR
jgi:hypothetical protein